MLAFHLTWIVWVMVGAFFTRGRPWLTALHLASLGWGIIVEVGPWPCPLTIVSQWLETKGGAHPYSGSFIVHILNTFVYPPLPVSLIVGGGVAVCGVNLLVYLYRLVQYLRRRGAGG